MVAVFPEPWSIDGTDGFQKIPRQTKLKMTGRHTVITDSLTLNVLNSLQDGARQTVRVIALRNSITVASALQILIEHMYMISGFSVI